MDQQEFIAKLVELLLPNDWEKAAALADLIDKRILAVVEQDRYDHHEDRWED